MNYDNSLVVTITVTSCLWAPFSGDNLFTCGAISRPPQLRRELYAQISFLPLGLGVALYRSTADS